MLVNFIIKNCHFVNTQKTNGKRPGPNAKPIACHIAKFANALALSFKVVDWDKTARHTATFPEKQHNAIRIG